MGVTISYLTRKALDEYDTLERRDALASSWLFFCECHRCVQVKAPACPLCASTGMTVVMSKAEEPLYPGLDVFCDICKAEDIQGDGGYFFTCSACTMDLCPLCAFSRSGIDMCNTSAFDGRWT